MPHVAAVEDPVRRQRSISPDGRTLVARLYLDVANPNDMPVEDTERLLAAAEEAEHDGLESRSAAAPSSSPRQPPRPS